MAYEKMPCLYETERDLTDRLGNTICRYKGKAVLVQVEGKKTLSLLDPVSALIIQTIKPDDPEFDISSAEIGYFNYEGTPERLKRFERSDHSTGVYYAQRRPIRRFRQGLYAECLSLLEIDGPHNKTFTNSFLFSDGFRKSIEGTYPSINEAIELLRLPVDEAPKSLAISREFALQRVDSGIILVYCCCTNVGYIVPRSNNVNYVDNEYSWVTDLMINRNRSFKKGM